MLSSAVRDTLLKHGIPPSWVGAETLPARTPSQKGGLHLRMVLRTADPKLLANMFPLERAIQVRLSQLAPDSRTWLMGTSWRIDVPLGSDTAELPGPAFWRTNRKNKSSATAAQGPLERAAVALAVGDSAFASMRQETPEFHPTQPMAAH